MFDLIVNFPINLFYQRFSPMISFSLSLQVAEQDYKKEKLNERITKISGGVAVIQVKFGMVELMVAICNNSLLLAL
jgi:hypothetical protein